MASTGAAVLPDPAADAAAAQRWGAMWAGVSLLFNWNRLAPGSGWRWWRAGEQGLIVMDTGMGMEPGQLIDALGLGHSNKPPPGVTRGGSTQ